MINPLFPYPSVNHKSSICFYFSLSSVFVIIIIIIIIIVSPPFISFLLSLFRLSLSLPIYIPFSFSSISFFLHSITIISSSSFSQTIFCLSRPHYFTIPSHSFYFLFFISFQHFLSSFLLIPSSTFLPSLTYNLSQPILPPSLPFLPPPSPSLPIHSLPPSLPLSLPPCHIRSGVLAPPVKPPRYPSRYKPVTLSLLPPPLPPSFSSLISHRYALSLRRRANRYTPLRSHYVLLIIRLVTLSSHSMSLGVTAHYTGDVARSSCHYVDVFPVIMSVLLCDSAV